MWVPNRRSAEDATWTYVMATPDAVRGGALPVILNRLAAFDLRPVACQLISLEVERMKRFYNSTSFLIKNLDGEDYTVPWDLHKSMYAIAPAGVIMLAHPEGMACERMLRCKGNTRPEIAESCSVRSLGENVIFNLIHCPDDSQSARSELQLLMGNEAASSMMTITGRFMSELAQPAELRDLVGVSAMFDCMPAFAGPEAISFVSIANTIRCRVVQLLALIMHADDNVIGALARARQLLAKERGQLDGSTGTATRLRIARQVNRHINADLILAARRSGIAGLAEGLQALSDLFDLRGRRDLQRVFSLSSNGIYIDALERIIIESHSHAFRPHYEIDNIYP